MLFKNIISFNANPTHSEKIWSSIGSTSTLEFFQNFSMQITGLSPHKILVGNPIACGQWEQEFL